MAQVVVPISSGENQNFSLTLPVNNQNITLALSFTWNDQGSYWFMSITDNSGNLLLDAVPVIPGIYPTGDLLRQYQYLGIGSAFLVPNSQNLPQYPTFDGLGTDFVLVWSDSVEVAS